MYAPHTYSHTHTHTHTHTHRYTYSRTLVQTYEVLLVCTACIQIESYT